MSDIQYRMDLGGVDWTALNQTLAEDHFDNGRTPDQLQRSFENSFASVIAWHDGRVIGKARVLSDGVCNAYMVDVWTYTPFRKRGIARRMIQMLIEKLPGQHVFLFTDDVPEFYRKLGFVERPTGLEMVVGKWLGNDTRR